MAEQLLLDFESPRAEVLKQVRCALRNAMDAACPDVRGERQSAAIELGMWIANVTTFRDVRNPTPITLYITDIMDDRRVPRRTAQKIVEVLLRTGIVVRTSVVGRPSQYSIDWALVRQWLMSPASVGDDRAPVRPVGRTWRRPRNIYARALRYQIVVYLSPSIDRSIVRRKRKILFPERRRTPVVGCKSQSHLILPEEPPAYLPDLEGPSRVQYLPRPSRRCALGLSGSWSVWTCGSG